MTEPSIDVDAEIKRIARAARTENDSMPLDDLVQELWVFYLEHGNIQSYAPGQQMKLLRQEAKKRLAQERIDYMYFSGAFVYTPAIVRAYLDECVWQAVEDSFDIDGRVDVQEAFKRLSAQQQMALYIRHCLGEGDKFTNAQKKAASVGVDKIVHHLNGQLVLDEQDLDHID